MKKLVVSKQRRSSDVRVLCLGASRSLVVESTGMPTLSSAFTAAEVIFVHHPILSVFKWGIPMKYNDANSVTGSTTGFFFRLRVMVIVCSAGLSVGGGVSEDTDEAAEATLEQYSESVMDADADAAANGDDESVAEDEEAGRPSVRVSITSAITTSENPESESSAV